MTIKFDRRAPRGHNYLKLAGAKIGLLKVIELAGYAKHSTVFLCKCDCGNTCYRRGAFLNQARWNLLAGKNLTYRNYFQDTHCGCLSRKISGLDDAGHSFYVKQNKLGTLCDAWLDRKVFHDQFWSKRPPTPENRKNNTWRPVRLDHTQPWGPGNAIWSLSTTDKAKLTFFKVVDAIQRKSGVDRKMAIARAMNVTRERRRQLLWRSQGRCIRCGKPVAGYRCYECEPPKTKWIESYDRWLNGKLWTLTPGKDFEEKPEKLQSRLRSRARTKGLRLIWRFKDGKAHVMAIK